MADPVITRDSADRDEPDPCPYCGGVWGPALSAPSLREWVVAHCTRCEATKMTPGPH